MLTDVQATRQLGALLARHCPWSLPGARCLFLSGELGSGKTTLAAALLDAMGVRETVRSPSYALIEIYGLGAHLAVHADLYRLHGVAELEQLGLRDYLQPETLLLIEWPEHGEGALPRADLWLRLELPRGDGSAASAQASVGAEGRICRAQALSSAGERWLAMVCAELPFSGVF
jgi:tRNA threonylcarbamoyladenosine biosynthesis protein TsaE